MRCRARYHSIAARSKSRRNLTPTSRFIADASPTPTRAVAFVPMNQLTSGDKGKLVAVRGKVVAMIPFSKGMKYRLDDTTGKVILLLWQDVFDALPDAAKLAKDAQVSVTGTVDVFDGEIEVVPESAADVQVIP